MIASVTLAAVLPFTRPAAAHAGQHVTATALFIRPRPASVGAVQETYTVRSGDTLSSIAGHEYGSSGRWPELWLVNRHSVRNPNDIRAGQVLRLTPWHHAPRAWVAAKAMRHIPKPKVITVHHSGPWHYAVGSFTASTQQAVQQAAPAAPAPVQNVSAGGSFQNCVIQAESGGNPSAVNASSGAGGLYGFLPSTWAALGYSGLPENASVATQNAAFAAEYAQAGTSPWSAYDGC